MTLEKLSHMRGTRPASTSCSAGAGPLYGTWNRSTWAALFKSSPQRWLVEALPPEPKLSAPGLLFARAMTSPSVFTGRLGCATQTFGVVAALVTGVRSFRGLYGRS